MKYAKRPDLFTVNSKDGIPLVKANSDYGRFNCNNMGANLQSWNYRSCWHQTGPLLDFTPLERRRPTHYSHVANNGTGHYLLRESRVGKFRACCCPWT